MEESNDKMLHPKEKTFLHALGASEDAQSFEDRMRTILRKIVEEEKGQEVKEVQALGKPGKVKGKTPNSPKVCMQEKAQNSNPNKVTAATGTDNSLNYASENKVFIPSPMVNFAENPFQGNFNINGGYGPRQNFQGNYRPQQYTNGNSFNGYQNFQPRSNGYGYRQSFNAYGAPVQRPYYQNAPYFVPNQGPRGQTNYQGQSNQPRFVAPMYQNNAPQMPNRPITCFECNEKGHYRSECPKLKDSSKEIPNCLN